MGYARKVVAAGILVSIGIVSLNAFTQDGSKHQPLAFAEFDLDNSGFISEDEFNTVRGEHMAAKAEEGKPMRCASSAPSFSEVDTSGDGQLTADELTAGQVAHHASCRAMHQGDSKGHGQGYGKGHGQGYGKGYGEGHGLGHDQAHGKKKDMRANMPSYADFDLDGDGAISETEFNEAHAKRMSERAAEGHQMKHAGNMPTFTDIDMDGDGGISENEFAAHQSEHHARMQENRGDR